MLSHLKAQNRAIEKAIKDVNAFLKKTTDGGVQLDDHGRCRLQYREVGVHIVALSDHNLIIFKAFTNTLPDAASGKLLPLYYHLLDQSDNPGTGLAYFCIVSAEEIGMENDVISVEVKRPLADIDYDEFTSSVQAVGEVANLWMQKLEEEFGAPHIP